MVVSFRDGLKLSGVALICACAAFVSFLFSTYLLDLPGIADDIPPGPARVLYDAQVSSAKVVLAVTCCALVATSIVVLLFYIRQYIDSHSKQLGVLKALGWTRMEISRSFSVFGLSTLLGTGAGCACAIWFLPSFLETMNEDGLFPDIEPTIHPILFLYIVVIPALAFSAVSILGAAHRLKASPVFLLKGIEEPSGKKQNALSEHSDYTFMQSVRKSIVQTSKPLAFFVFMGGFCFSCMLQMSSSMDELSSELMGSMMLVIGVVLAVTCLALSVSSAVRRCLPAAAIMHACGYTANECRSALLGGFRPFAYIGFAAGTVYQYVLLRLMVDVVFADFPDMPEYSFDVSLMFICLGLFVVFYEAGSLLWTRRLTNTPIRDLAGE